MAGKTTGAKAAKKPAPKRKPPVKKTVEAPDPMRQGASVVADDDGSAGEEAVRKALTSNDTVRFYVPRDPTSGDDQYFERSINGHIIRLKAVEIRELPLWLVEFIEERISIQRLNESAYDEFKTKNGKLLQ